MSAFSIKRHVAAALAPLVGALAVVLIPGATATTLNAQAAAAATEETTASVEIDGISLFRVRGVSSFQAEDRAAAIAGRIADAAADPSIPPDSLRILGTGNDLRIVAGDRPLMAVVEADATLEGVSTSDLATAHLARMRDAIIEYRQARSGAALRTSFIRSVAATVAFAAVVWLLVLIWRGFVSRVRSRVESHIQTVGIQSFEVVRAERIRALLQSLLLAARIVVLVTLTLVCTGYVLRQWPSTRGMARNVTALAVGPVQTLAVGLIAALPSLAFLAVLWVVLRITLRLIRLFFESVGSGAIVLSNFDPDWAQPTYKIVRIGVVAFGLIVAYPYIPGSQSEAFKGVSLFIGIVFSLGSSTAISNIIAGYMMTYRRAFKLGDRVKIGDAIGEVSQMRLQVTHLRTSKNEEILIPNSQILSNDVMNYSSLSRDRGLLLHTEVGIGYDVSWRRVESMLLSAAARTEGLGSQPSPFVLIKRLGDFAVVYELNAPCGEVNKILAQYSALHQNVLDVFNEHGVQIMTPSYEADPPEPKVVPSGEWAQLPVRPGPSV